MKDVMTFLSEHGAPDDLARFASRFETLETLWDNCPRTDWMLWLLEQLGPTDQKLLRLFACSCARDHWDYLTDERSRNAVEVAERFAEGKASKEELLIAKDLAGRAAQDAYVEGGWHSERIARIAWGTVITHAAAAAKHTSQDTAFFAGSRPVADSPDGWAAAMVRQTNRLRELFGNPFAKPPIEEEAPEEQEHPSNTPAPAQ